MTNKEKKEEEILFEALSLMDEGKTIPEICDMFPGHAKEIKETLQMADLLMKSGKSATPSRNALYKIISDLPESKSVNNEAYEKKENGITIRDLFNFGDLEFWKNKAYAGAGVLAILLVAGLFYWQNQKIAEAPRDNDRNGTIVKNDLDNGKDNIDNISQNGIEGGIPKDQGVKDTPIAVNQLPDNSTDTDFLDRLGEELNLELMALDSDLVDLGELGNDINFEDFDFELTASS